MRSPTHRSELSLLTPQQLADALGVPLKTVERWRWAGYGPAFVKVGKHCRYQLADVQAWLERQRRGGGEEQPAACK